MTGVPGLCGVHWTLRLVEILAVTYNGLAWPETGCRPLVVEVGGDPPLHLVPLAQVERGPVQEVVVAGREAVDEVEGEAAQKCCESVLGDPPDLVGQEGGGKCTRYKAGIVRTDDGVKQDLKMIITLTEHRN